jgi:hypothetical protein
MKDAYYQGVLPLLLAVATTIAVENSRPGTADWEITHPALHQEIEGYASLTSVNTGDPIDLLVSTGAARYSIDVFRMGCTPVPALAASQGPSSATASSRASHQPIQRPDSSTATGAIRTGWIRETNPAAGRAESISRD